MYAELPWKMTPSRSYSKKSPGASRTPTSGSAIRVSPEWHGIKHFWNSVSDVGLVERHSDVW
jgi:hypothetical protein